MQSDFRHVWQAQIAACGQLALQAPKVEAGDIEEAPGGRLGWFLNPQRITSKQGACAHRHAPIDACLVWHALRFARSVRVFFSERAREAYLKKTLSAQKEDW